MSEGDFEFLTCGRSGLGWRDLEHQTDGRDR